MNEVKVERWHATQGPTESAILELLRARGLRGYAWSGEPREIFSEHAHPYHKVIYVVDGSLAFTLPALQQQVELGAGDHLDLPAHALHSAIVGAAGVLCYEAHIPAD